jgi:hypothetical protein
MPRNRIPGACAVLVLLCAATAWSQVSDSLKAAITGHGAGPAKGAVKTIAVVDPFFGNMPAFKVTVPADWTVDGAVLRSNCGDGVPFFVYRAYSPDRLSGVQLIPQTDWYAAVDERVFQQAKANPCNLHDPARAADVAPKIAAELRAGAQIEATPPLTAKQSAQLRQESEQARQFWDRANQQFPPNFRNVFDVGAQRVRLRYNFEGHPLEEMVTVTLRKMDQPVSVFGTNRQGIIQPAVARLIHTAVTVSTIRAPAGKLDAAIDDVERIVSVDVLPEWNAAQSAFQQQQHEKVMAAIQRNGQIMKEQMDQFGARMKAQNDQYHAWQQEQGARHRAQFAERMRQKDAQSQNFLDYVKNQQYYVNPSTGATGTLPNLPGVSGYAGMTPQGNWVQLVPISH